MKKTFALLMLAAMLLSTGCGNTMDGAKKDAQEAQQKIEQKADEAKEKVDEAKKDAEAKVDEAKAKADEMKAGTEAAMDNMSDAVAGRIIEFGGVKPGMTLDEAKKILGEPSAADNDELTFANGLIIETNDGATIIEEIKSRQSGNKTPDGVEVGMMEYALNDYCGAADKIEMDDGEVEYEYHSGDKKSKIVYKARNGLITEITCSLND